MRRARLVSYAYLYTTVNASSGRDTTSVTVNSERGEHVGINASFENASGKYMYQMVLHISNVNDETRNNIPDEISELSVAEKRFDRQTHTHHSYQRFCSATLEVCASCVVSSKGV